MLIICPTPIGNLGDITERQRQALAGADIIACEDTRRAGKLLERLGIVRVDGHPSLWRYDDHRAQAQVEPLLEALGKGIEVVLISDAGTPTISDPGYRLVRACRAASLEVTALPGPVAAVVALSGSGMASDTFFFEGFLPNGRGERVARLQAFQEMRTTIVAYDSPRRIEETLEDVSAVFGGAHEVCVARELTKVHEEYLVGAVSNVAGRLKERESVRGEIVLCIAPGGQNSDEQDVWKEADQAIEVLHGQQLSSRTIKDIISQLYEVPRSQIYDRIESVIGE